MERSRRRKPSGQERVRPEVLQEMQTDTNLS